MLTQAKRVLVRWYSDDCPDSTRFALTDSPDLYMCILEPEDWIEMGRPSTITVTIEPGDTLNP